MSSLSGRRGRFRLQMPAPSGGLDAAQEPDAIGDNRLADSLNLWWERGALRTRPGLYSTAAQCAVLHAAPEPDVEDTYSFGGVTAQGLQTMVGEVPAEVVTERFTENGFSRILPLRLGNDGSLYPYLDDDQKPMSAMYSKNCLVVASEYGKPLFFMDDGVRIIGGESIEGRWMDMEEWIYSPLLLVGGSGVKLKTEGTVTGRSFEAPNLLTSRFRAQYTTDGEGIYYFLPQKRLSAEPVTACLEDNTGSTHFYTIEADATASAAEWSYTLHVDRTAGCVWFTGADGTPAAVVSSVHGGNLTVEAGKANPTARKKILGMTLSCWFGGDSGGLRGGTRLFLAGNPLYPHLVHWSDVNNALYFPEGNYAYVGDADQRITALCRQEDSLILFKERELYAAGYESTPVSAADLTAGTVSDVTAACAAFPLVPLSSEIGCDCPATIRLCHGRLVWANRNGGVYTLLSRDACGARNVRTLSGAIAPLLRGLSADDWNNASAAAADGWYLLLTGHTVWALRFDSPAFVRYAGYAADREAQKQLCWFRLDVTVPGVTWQLLSGRGSGAVFYGLQEENGSLIRRLYTFSGKADCVPQTTGFAETPIFFSAETARLDLGEPGTYKDVTGARLDLTAEASARVKITLTDGEGGAWYSPALPVTRGCRLLTGLRGVRRVQLKLQGCGSAALSGWELTGTETGGVK